MELRERRLDGVTLVEMMGPLRLDDGVEQFCATMRRLIAAGDSRIVLNMAGCQSVDSAGLGELASALVRARKAGGNLILLELPPRTEQLLQVTRLRPLFTVCTDESSAIVAARPMATP
jgi:anti-sigma B factor antagonist